MRPYSPGGALNALASPRTGSIPLTASAHRLRLGLPGYLILFAPLAFVPQCQVSSRDSPSPLVFLSISTHFTATPRIPVSPPTLERESIQCSSRVEPGDFTSNFPCHLRTIRPVNPNNAWDLCITAAAGTELAVPSSFATINFGCIRPKDLLANDRGLRTEAIHPPRGVAPSGFRPL